MGEWDVVSHTPAPPDAGGWTVVKQESPGLLSDIGDTLKQYWDKINPVTAAQSLATVAAHPIAAGKAYGEETAKLHAAAQESFKKGEYSEGLRHTLSYFLNGIPGIGTALDEAGNKAGRGDIKGAIADTAALATNLAGPKIAEAASPVIAQGVSSASRVIGNTAPVRAAREATARGLMKSAIKPGVADAPELSDIRKVVGTALENEIPVTEAGTNKLQALISDYAQKTQAAVDARTRAGYTVDPQRVASRLDQVNTTSALPEREIATVNKAKEAFLERKGVRPAQPPTSTGVLNASGQPVMRPGSPASPGQPVPFDVAQAEKQGSYQKVQKAYGELSDAQIESEKALARGYKEEMEAQAPELKALNAKEAEFLGLQPALERAVRRAGNADIMDLKGAVEIAAAPHLGFVARVLDYPGIKSKLAIAINKGSQKTARPLSMAQSAAKATAVLNQLSVLSGGAQPEQSETGTSQ